MADIRELQEKLAEEGTDEGAEDYGSNEPVDLSFLEEQKTPVSDVIAAKAAAAAERTGGAARRLLGGIGERIEAPAAPSDDLSDLFEGPDMEKDNDVYIKDVVSVEEEDVFGEGGADMSDILEVSEEDVMGDEDVEGYEPKAQATSRVARRVPRATPPPSGLAGVQ